MNIEVICEDSMCDRCKKEKATEVYDTYSTINGGTLLVRPMCKDCYSKTIVEDRE